MPRDARQHILTKLCVYLTASMAQSHLPVLNSSHSFLKLNPAWLHCFNKLKSSLVPGVYCRDLYPDPNQARLSRHKLLNKAPHSNYLHISSVLNQPEKRSMAGRLQGGLEGQLFTKPPEATWNSTKLKLKFLNRFPSLFLFQLLYQSEKTGWIISQLQPPHSLKFSSSDPYTQPASMPFIYT